MIKIFKMNDYDWYAGETLDVCIDAMAAYMNEPRNVCVEEYVDKPRELTERELAHLRMAFESDCYPGMRYGYVLKRMILEGKEFPCFFASTEF